VHYISKLLKAAKLSISELPQSIIPHFKADEKENAENIVPGFTAASRI
jgi:hypothetical protein